MKGGHIEASQIQNNAPKRFKHGLKCSQEDTLEVPCFLRQYFFQNRNVGTLNFFLSVKNDTPEVCVQVYKGFPNPD